MRRVLVATAPKLERSAFRVGVALGVLKPEPLHAFTALNCVPHRDLLEKCFNALGSAISPQPSRDAFKLVSSEIYFASGSLKIQPTISSAMLKLYFGLKTRIHLHYLEITDMASIYASNGDFSVEDQATMLTGLVMLQPVAVRLLVRELLESRPEYLQANYAPDQDVNVLDFDEICLRVSELILPLDYLAARLVVLDFLLQMSPNARNGMWYRIYLASQLRWGLL